MDRVFIGPWILNWWQRGLASLLSFLYHLMSAIVQKIQVWVTSTSNQFLKPRAWKAHPVTVSEYVKSWMRDTSSTQTTRLKAPTWIFNRPSGHAPSKACETAKLWAKFQAPQATMESLKGHNKINKIKDQEPFRSTGMPDCNHCNES
jgi:hypothetical protein